MKIKKTLKKYYQNPKFKQFRTGFKEEIKDIQKSGVKGIKKKIPLTKTEKSVGKFGNRLRYSIWEK